MDWPNEQVAMLRTVIHAESVIGHGEMAEALGAVLEASNSDPASSGFSPWKAASWTWNGWWSSSE